ncbi:MAG: class I SAM-dependent methyltransferase [Saprospiraceae bacterium]|nr:class I SAM-dependent methyltransferase [Saprospiraceae bacterium]
MIGTAERVSDHDQTDNYVYQRCLFAYHEAVNRISGRVLEIGTGSGLGVKLIAAQCNEFITVDKYASDIEFSQFPNARFLQMEIPPFKGFEDNYFDFVISFQVIEHLEDDSLFVKEILRVLKKGGKAILTTPNRIQSLSRNPWHVREYLGSELEELLLKQGFNSVEKLGTFGNTKVLEYIESNKASIKKITRFDIFNFQYKLPRKLLQIPYDFFNRMNRKMIAKNITQVNGSIKVDDFYVGLQNEDSLDLFFIATK